MQGDNYPEPDLIERAKKGDQDAFEDLVRLHEKKVYSLAFRMCGNPQHASEIAQEAFLSAWQGLPFFRQESNFSTWLYRLTSNACVDFLRRENRQKATSLDDDDFPLTIPDTSPSPEDAYETRELQEQIQQGLSSLSDDHRSVLILREIHQLSYDEIAETLSIDLGTVKSRINRGRLQLRNFLLKHGTFSHLAPSKQSEKTKKEGQP